MIKEIWLQLNKITSKLKHRTKSISSL